MGRNKWAGAGVSPPPLDSKKELGLAIWMWRALRLRYYDVRGSNAITNDCPDATEAALRMAKEYGVEKEFLEWVTTLDVTKITVRNLDASGNKPATMIVESPQPSPALKALAGPSAARKRP
jgi:hypothetical protein